MLSGLLDRAETVFSDLAKIDQRAPQALKHLIGIKLEHTERVHQIVAEAAGRIDEVGPDHLGADAVPLRELAGEL